MRILFAATEAAPFFKTGGLGDVAGALPKELARKGEDVRVVLPLWKNMKEQYKEQLADALSFDVYVGYRRQYCGIKTVKMDGVQYYFIDNMYYFDRDGLYGYFDDGERFAFFQMAIIEMMEKVNFIPDVLHVNDYHTAFIPFLLKEKYRWIQAFKDIRTVLTIHNMQFQGIYEKAVLWDLYGVGAERFDDGTLVWDGRLNTMKAGVLYADRVTTVSKSYAQEIQRQAFGEGLDQVLRMENGKLSGILNGIDYDMNDPEKDPLIEHHFSIADLSPKALNKADIQKHFGLPVKKEIPLIAMVSRLTLQKGFHLILQELSRILEKDVQVVLLGTGFDKQLEDDFRSFGEQYPEKMGVSISFDVKLAQLMYAGSDLFLMPSAFEPCGLSQMISMRYGTLPIVHEIGGLKDTVIPYNKNTGEGTGFGFSEFTGLQLANAVFKAIELYENDKKAWKKLQVNAMQRDFSWETSSERYLLLYKGLFG